jgi:hypothetical protein
VIETVRKRTRMCAMFTYRSVANSGKSADRATGIHVERITDGPAEPHLLSVLLDAENAQESDETGYGNHPVSCPARAT